MGAAAGPDIIEDGLVLCLDAANRQSYAGSGTVWRDLAGSNNGTLVNGPTFSSANGGSIVFDGTNDYVAISNLGLSSHTIEGWFNSSDGSQGGNIAATICSIFGNYDDIQVSKYALIGLIPNLTFRIDDGVTSFAQIAEISYSANTWYHVALTYNASDGDTRAYVNGNQIGSRSSTTNIVFNSIPFNMSKSQTGTYFDGLIAVGKAYNRALTPAEILQNYNATKGRFRLT